MGERKMTGILKISYLMILMISLNIGAHSRVSASDPYEGLGEDPAPYVQGRATVLEDDYEPYRTDQYGQMIDPETGDPKVVKIRT